MNAIFEEIRRRLEAGEVVATATVVRRRGSTPREVGARMLVRRDGSIIGTVGGGCGEADVRRAALDSIETGRASLVRVDLTEEQTMTTEGVCGGIMDVLVQPWVP